MGLPPMSAVHTLDVEPRLTGCFVCFKRYAEKLRQKRGLIAPVKRRTRGKNSKSTVKFLSGKKAKSVQDDS